MPNLGPFQFSLDFQNIGKVIHTGIPQGLVIFRATNGFGRIQFHHALHGPDIGQQRRSPSRQVGDPKAHGNIFTVEILLDTSKDGSRKIYHVRIQIVSMKKAIPRQGETVLVALFCSAHVTILAYTMC